MLKSAVIFIFLNAFTITAHADNQKYMDQIFTEGAAIDTYALHLNSKFSCNYYRDRDPQIICTLPKREDIEKIKSAFKNKKAKSCEVLSQIKKLSYENLSQELDQEALAFQNEVGNNAYSDYIFNVSGDVKTSFNEQLLAECLEIATSQELEKKYFMELDHFMDLVDSSLSAKEYFDFFDNIRLHLPVMTKINDAASDIYVLLFLSKSLDQVYELGDKYKNLTDKLATKNCDNLLKDDYFYIQGRYKNSGALSLVSKSDREILKKLISGPNQWSIQCSSLSKYDPSFKKKFNLDHKNHVINLPFHKRTTCHWWNCEGQTIREMVTVTQTEFLSKLRSELK